MYYFQEWVCHGVALNIIRHVINELAAPLQLHLNGSIVLCELFRVSLFPPRSLVIDVRFSRIVECRKCILHDFIPNFASVFPMMSILTIQI